MGDFLKTGSSEGKKLGSLEGKLFTLKSLSSNPPTLLSSDNHPSPLPSPTGEGAICHPELVSGSQETIACHSEPAGERIQPIIADGGQEVRKSGQFRG